MAGDAVHHRGVLVVHLAPKHSAAPGVHLGRRNAREPVGWGQVTQRREAEGSKDPLLQQRVDALMVDSLQYLGENDGAQIGVDVLRPGRIFQRSGVCQREGVLPAGHFPEQRPPGREPSGMSQKQTNGDLFLLRSGEGGNVALNRSIEVDLPFAHRQHQPGRKSHHLGQRSEIVQGGGPRTAGIEIA